MTYGDRTSEWDAPEPEPPDKPYPNAELVRLAPTPVPAKFALVPTTEGAARVRAALVLVQAGFDTRTAWRIAPSGHAGWSLFVVAELPALVSDRRLHRGWLLRRIAAARLEEERRWRLGRREAGRRAD